MQEGRFQDIKELVILHAKPKKKTFYVAYEASVSITTFAQPKSDPSQPRICLFAGSTLHRKQVTCFLVLLPYFIHHLKLFLFHLSRLEEKINK